MMENSPRFASSVILALALAACDAPAVNIPTAPQTDRTGEVRPPAPPSSVPVHYDATKDGFVVHEWGTLTNVVGSDGALLPGLHHEEEDLPNFVADRMIAASANSKDPAFVSDTLSQKLETPVTYFYSPQPRFVSVSVGFPAGLLTQWYPWVQRMSPQVFDAGGALIDRWSQTLESIPAGCQRTFSGEPKDGLLDWGSVHVLAPLQTVDLPGPIGDTTWGFARKTASNPIEVLPAGDRAQREKFLFYRGLGNFPLPLRATIANNAATFSNGDPGGTMGGLFLMVVTKDGAGWVELGDLDAGAVKAAALPEATSSHEDFVAGLKSRLAARLVADGLYTDEAQAMVDTWERGYFLTPGVRLLYLLPQAHTDRILPLKIAPAPDRLARTVVIRMELLTDGYEQLLTAQLQRLGNASEKPSAEKFFLGLGRFAEPHLTRAIALSPAAGTRPETQAFLDRIRAQRRWNSTAAE